MVKKIIVLLACALVWQAQAMDLIADMGDVITDFAIVQAVKTNSPEALKSALDARMGSIKLQFQVQLNDANHSYLNKRQAIQEKNKVVRTQLEKGLKSSFDLRIRTITRNYNEAQEKFKNAEIPAYLRLALERRKTSQVTKSELIAEGGVLLGLSVMLTGYALREETSTLSTLLFLPVGIVGCLAGARKLCDGIDYAGYLEHQQSANDAVQQILKARQGNWFEQAIYKLNVNA